MTYLVVFESVHQAIRSERLLRQAQLPAELIPTPREITASCGQSLRFETADLAGVTVLLQQAGVSYRGIFSADLARRLYECIQQGGVESGTIFRT
jgi:hypothetical protein